jgi:ectoine hydroxylase-related dioxygenase (phytanoyl-CoA dioxygenase family)
MLSDSQLQQYREKGFIVVENLLPPETLAAVQETTDAFVEQSRHLTEHDAVYDLADTHCADDPRVRRLKAPHNVHPVFDNLIRDPVITDVVSQLIGESLRIGNTKLNFKEARGGATIEWHQDWAFYPHTNDDLLAAGIFLDDCDLDNGPMLCVPGSHTGPLDDHHHSGHFVGAVDPAKSHYDVETAEPVTGKAGSISLHHTRCLHASRKNNSNRSRRIFFVEYLAADAWPLKGIAEGVLAGTSGGVDLTQAWDAFNNRIIKGTPLRQPRIVDNPVILPYPPAPSAGSIYENQKEVAGRSFGE